MWTHLDTFGRIWPSTSHSLEALWSTIKSPDADMPPEGFVDDVISCRERHTDSVILQTNKPIWVFNNVYVFSTRAWPCSVQGSEVKRLEKFSRVHVRAGLTALLPVELVIANAVLRHQITPAEMILTASICTERHGCYTEARDACLSHFSLAVN